MTDTLDGLVSAYGQSLAARYRGAAPGDPEDQLTGPVEALVRGIADLLGRTPSSVVLTSEVRRDDLLVRPDIAVAVDGALVGYIELKAPGTGTDPRRFGRGHNRTQWAKLQALPNLIYTDGNAFSLWRSGEPEGEIVQLEGDVETSGARLRAPASLLRLVQTFLAWQPEAPRSARELATTAARLCRLLRDEATEELAAGTAIVRSLREDWRQVLFPEANDAGFADGYAQAVTFGLLVARARGIALDHGPAAAAQSLQATDSLIGTALTFLTNNPAALRTSIQTITRVLGVVDWPTVSRGEPDAWLYFYEEFLQVYDPRLRRESGSYYTPPEVVEAMIRLCDEALKSPSRFALPGGLRHPEVTVADPATGTGTFLLGLLRHIAREAESDGGLGLVPGEVADASRRLVGFELQFGPFVVAQLRLMAELAALTRRNSLQPRLFLTNTLSNPHESRDRLPSLFEPLTASYEEANRIKREEPITVVIGNPPYKDKARGLGAWVENGAGRQSPAPLRDWLPPTEWGVSDYVRHMRNLYVYFWRWAAWKVFGGGAGQGSRRDRKGIVCFITAAGFLANPGFQRMRERLRAEADEIWVIDCTPEGHQPEVPTRIFEGVQQEVCIVLAARHTDEESDVPATVRFRQLPSGPRERKFATLSTLTLDDAGWTLVEGAPRSSFLPPPQGLWARFVALKDIFAYDGTGVMAGRTWVIAPDHESLERRWSTLQGMTDQVRRSTAFFPHLRDGLPGDRYLAKASDEGLAGHEFRSQSVAADTGPVVRPSRYAMRSFDRQWVIPDRRLINQPNPTLWSTYSNRQVFLTTPEDRAPSNGPAVTFSGLIPDVHHYNNRGGRVFPLWADPAASEPNVRSALLAALGGEDGLNSPVSAPDVMAWIAAVAAHPAFTVRFQPDLVRPGLRVPLTADQGLWIEGVALGREIIWLHSYGERFADPSSGRPTSPPRVDDGPRIPAEGAIPAEPGHMPDELRYDGATRRLHVGTGFVENVASEVAAYEVSGKNVLRQWFGYRGLDRSRPSRADQRERSELDAIQPQGWPASYTRDLLDLLHVLTRLVQLEPRQAVLLEQACSGPLLDEEALRAAGAFDQPLPVRSEGGADDERQEDFGF